MITVRVVFAPLALSLVLVGTPGSALALDEHVVATSAVQLRASSQGLGESTLPRSGESPVPGKVLAWGSDVTGGLAIPPEAQDGVSAVAAGAVFLALKEGRVFAWGVGYPSLLAVPSDALSGVTAIDSGNSHSLALKEGRVIAWGDNEYGQSTVPAEALTGVSAISAGGRHSLALKNGRVIAWGLNNSGQASVPEEALSGIVAISAGDGHSMALSRFGKVIAWGLNNDGQATVPSNALAGVTAIAAGGGQSLAVKDGGVIAWGRNDFGETRVPAEALSGVTAVTAAGQVSMALKDGRVLAWGYEPGDGRATVPDAASAGVTAFAAGGATSLAIRPVLSPPLAPERVIAQAGDGQVRVSWQLAAGSEPATSALVTATPGGRTCSATLETACVVLGLSNGTPYTFTVVAQNERGQSQASPPSPPSTPRGAPGSPNSVSAVAGNSQVLVSWQAPGTDGASPITRYVVASTPGNQTCSTEGLTSCVVSGLTNGVPYTFAVVASNAVGASQPSRESLPAVPSAQLPTVPRSVTGVAGNAEAVIVWLPPLSEGGTAISGYRAVASPGAATCSSTGSLTCTIEGLTNGTSYTFTVTATNAAGTSLASTPSAPVIPGAAPAAPSSVTGRPGDAQVTVSWAPPSSTGSSPITGYTATASPGGATCSTTGVLTCAIVGLTNGTNYTFTVTATNAAGTSLASAASDPVTPGRGPGVVRNLRATPLKGVLRVAWSPPSGSGGSGALSYQYKVGKGRWIGLSSTRVNIKGRAGAAISLAVRAVNDFGPGPASRITGRPR